MKKIISSLWMLCMLANAHAYTGYNICNYGKQTIATVSCDGPTVLIDTTVMGDVTVVGTFKATNVSMGLLNITGDTDLDSCKITGAANVIGTLNATKTIFRKGLMATTDHVLLHHTTVRGTLVMNSANTNPTLTMECGSSVSGTVTFIGKAGIIHITDDSIVQGKITNGSMIFDKKSC